MPIEFSPSLLAPLPLLCVAALAFRRPGRRPGALTLWSELSALAAFALAGAGVVHFVAWAVIGGAEGQAVLGGLLRIDAIMVTMTLLVAFIGWIVMRYSRTYLDGEDNEGAFHGLMLSTLAVVLVFVQAGNLLAMILATALVGVALRQLLMFYATRAEARRAATKFALVWHGGDIALSAAAGLLFLVAGTTDIRALGSAAVTGHGPWGELAIALIVVAAVLKTAAFPLHGWLTEVMEAPTPVSSLLHAGIINSGGVLLIVSADLVQSSPGAMAALVMLGGFTALFGAAVMLTQSAVKTALAWSTVAQMGFMLLQCGLGLWALALLHIVAHSLYKAHAFLSSGGAVAAVAGLHRPGPVTVPDVVAVSKAFAVALALYGLIAVSFTAALGPKSPQALAMGAILIFGVAYLIAQGLADLAPVELTRRTAAASFGTAVAYFAFQEVAQRAWGDNLPVPPVPGPLEWALIVLALVSFGLVAFAQALFPHWAHHPASAGFRVHLANGLYLNALLDRAIGGFRVTKSN